MKKKFSPLHMAANLVLFAIQLPYFFFYVPKRLYYVFTFSPNKMAELAEKEFPDGASSEELFRFFDSIINAKLESIRIQRWPISFIFWVLFIVCFLVKKFPEWYARS